MTANLSSLAPVPTPSLTRKRQPTISTDDFRDEFLSEVDKMTKNLTEYCESVEEKEKDNPLWLGLTAAIKLLSMTVDRYVPRECPIEKERRERSVVIELMPESTKKLASERVDEDYANVRAILDAADIEVRPETVFRMGQKKTHQQGRSAPPPRLLKVVLPRASSQKTLIKSSRSITNNPCLKSCPALQRIRIRPSLSSAEREAQWNLREEKRKRNQAGGPQWVIYAGVLMEKGKVAEFKQSPPPQNSFSFLTTQPSK
jgi:hypothetical protein